MKTKLIPPDRKQCQAEYLDGSFMTLGPRVYKRCTKVPVVIAKERYKDKNGQRGSMSMCEECQKVFLSQGGNDVVTFKPIK